MGVGVGIDGGVGVGVESGLSSQESQSLMKTRGTAARNKNGHLGKAPAATSSSPQSQMVPSTSPSSTISTPSCCPCGATVTPERTESVFVAPSAVSLRGPVCGVDPLVPGATGSCDTRELSLRSGVPCEFVSVWTTWLIRTGSASAGAAIKRKIESTAHSRRTRRRSLLPKN